jgi:hypothetical protein
MGTHTTLKKKKHEATQRTVQGGVCIYKSSKEKVDGCVMCVVESSAMKKKEEEESDEA